MPKKWAVVVVAAVVLPCLAIITGNAVPAVAQSTGPALAPALASDGTDSAPAVICTAVAEDRVQSERVDVSDFRLADYRAQGGSLWLETSVRNNCSTTQLIGVAAIVRAGEAPPGLPVAVSDSRYLRVPASSVVDVTLSLAGDLADHGLWVSFRVDGLLADQPPRLVCLEVSDASCLALAPDLVGTAEELAVTTEGSQLLQAAAERGLTLRSGTVTTKFWGTYDPETATVAFARAVDALPLWERSAIMAHELRYALDLAAGEIGATDDCPSSRANAFRVQGQVWNSLWQGHLPAPQTPLERVLARAAGGDWQDSRSLLSDLEETFSQACT